MTFAGLLILSSGVFLLALGSLPEVSRRTRSMFYGWVMAGIGALVMALGEVPLFHGMPIWGPVLRNTFGWSAGQISLALALTRAEGGLMGPVEGLLIQKLGPRRMVFIGMTIAGAGFMFFSQVRELWHFYMSFIIISVGIGLGTWLPMMTVLNHWFVRRRTMAMSIAMEGFALGGVIVPVLLAWAIGGTDPNISERYGWRASALFIGLLIMALAFPISRLVRNRPEDLGLNPDGDSTALRAAPNARAGVTRAEAEEGYTWQEAIRTSTFWLISFGHATSSIVIITVFVHLGLMLDDRGFSLQIISSVVAIYTAINAIFIPVGGYLGDRISTKLVAFWFSTLQSLAVVVLVLARDTEMLMIFAVLLGVGFGGRTAVTTAMRGIYFGRKAFATIMGISMVPMNILLFIAPVFAGFMRDATGNYDVAFLTIAAVSFFGACLFLPLGEPAKPPVPASRSSRAAG